MDEAYVYMLRGTSGRYYIGSTNDLARRLRQHNSGAVHSTLRLGLPLKLEATKACVTLREARQLERRLKSWKNPAKVLAFLKAPDSTLS